MKPLLFHFKITSFKMKLLATPCCDKLFLVLGQLKKNVTCFRCQRAVKGKNKISHLERFF